ncbi:conserved repeat domain-containing protein [Roseateles sp. YR242]|uniref:DUF11 domain-containing protein n=1 Tax=Roseateles sp. YR242 TaxID=1855305 RepID=UPI0008AAC532|nr:DUF11 domain-containing protein [Roseateles sp. YR242]SEK82579.1 conserved repeat domain-containing protein [Roseateles sp. YR242]
MAGDLITYTITFSNLSTEAIVSLKVTDATPAYTVFQSAACGTMPLPTLTCSISAQPAVGANGRVEWTIGGALNSGLSGTVTLVVKLQ